MVSGANCLQLRFRQVTLWDTFILHSTYISRNRKLVNFLNGSVIISIFFPFFYPLQLSLVGVIQTVLLWKWIWFSAMENVCNMVRLVRGLSREYMQKSFITSFMSLSCRIYLKCVNKIGLTSKAFTSIQPSEAFCWTLIPNQTSPCITISHQHLSLSLSLEPHPRTSIHFFHFSPFKKDESWNPREWEWGKPIYISPPEQSLYFLSGTNKNLNVLLLTQDWLKY